MPRPLREAAQRGLAKVAEVAKKSNSRKHKSKKRADEEEAEEEEREEEEKIEEGKRQEKEEEKEGEEEEEEEEEPEESPSSPEGTSDDSWSEEEEEEEDSDSDYEDDWSEEDEKRYRRRSNAKKKPTPVNKKQRTAGPPMAAPINVNPYLPVKPRDAVFNQSNYGFDFLLLSPNNGPTVDTVIGNFVNALEGACESYGNASSGTWLSDTPPQNVQSGTVIMRNVSMRIPAMTGRWMAGHLISRLGCCGAMFWHTDLVGPDPQSAASLIREFAQSGMEIIENNESEHLKNKGLRLIGRYSWDYYRQYNGGGYRIPQLASSLFGGPHCFLAPVDDYKNKIYPEILTRVNEFDNGIDVRFKPFLSRINHTGVLSVFPNQEYMFAKVFLQPGPNGNGWMGVRAMLLFTYNIGETWNECQIENVRI